MLYVLVVIEHGTRRLAYVDVTVHPIADWTLQQLREVARYDRVLLSTGYPSPSHPVLSIARHVARSAPRARLCEPFDRPLETSQLARARSDEPLMQHTMRMQTGRRRPMVYTSALRMRKISVR